MDSVGMRAEVQKGRGAEGACGAHRGRVGRIEVVTEKKRACVL